MDQDMDQVIYGVMDQVTVEIIDKVMDAVEPLIES